MSSIGLVTGPSISGEAINKLIAWSAASTRIGFREAEELILNLPGSEGLVTSLSPSRMH